MFVCVTGDYVGCFRDRQQRDLPKGHEFRKNNSPQLCIATCAQLSYAFAGVQVSIIVIVIVNSNSNDVVVVVVVVAVVAAAAAIWH